jgi:hypothetical protein
MNPNVHLRALLVLMGIVAVAATVWLSSSASANTRRADVVAPDAVLTWNTYTVNAVRASQPIKFQTDGMVYMSYVQAAVYDAVVRLDGRYRPYHDFAFTPATGASVRAAVAAASQTALDNYLPDQAATVDGEYASYITSLGGLDAPGVSDGVALGQAAANDIISLRTGDGLNNPNVPSYGQNGPILPGQWQLLPGQKVQTPFVATIRPFLLTEPNQFRASPPPPLTSRLYAKDLNETEAYGALNSTVRVPAQTAIAYFWVGDNINQYNVTMQTVVNQRQMDIVDAAHLFAIGNIVTTDAGIACYDSKFYYQSWRPTAAIQNADKDNNSATTADPSWQPLLALPGHPEYPSQHGCFTAAFTDTLAAALNTQHIDVVVPGGQNGSSVLTTTQHFNTVHDMQNQVVDARVWLGFHFRNSVIQGEKLGNNVAAWELHRYFKPTYS